MRYHYIVETNAANKEGVFTQRMRFEKTNVDHVLYGNCVTEVEEQK